MLGDIAFQNENASGNIHLTERRGELFLTAPQVSEVYGMLRALAGVCDNASSKDNAGFSKADLIGHYVIEVPQPYFDKDLALISLILIRKYKGQLAGFGFNPEPFIDLLKQVNKHEIAHIRATRADHQQRRVLLTTDGDFEIYFPNKKSLKGFNTHLPATHSWITERSIPHGYTYIVKRGARAFVAATVKQFTNWFMPEEVKALLEDEKLDSIDVQDTIKYDIYIYGENLSGLLTFKWDDIYRFLPDVKSFSSRRFNGKDAWNVSIKTANDLDLLRELTLREDCKVYASKGIIDDLKQFQSKREALVAEGKQQAEHQERQVYASRPQCLVSISDGVFILRFTKFSYAFVDWIKANLTDREFIREEVTYWKIKLSEHNIIKLHSMLNNEDWQFEKGAVEFIDNRYLEAVAFVEESQRTTALALRLSSQKLADDDFDFDTSIINGSLLPFQRVVLQYNTIRKNMLIGDDMGLGKTLTALACAANNQLQHSVNISCPAIARLTWRNEIRRWLPGATIYICKMANTEQDIAKEEQDILAADFVITSYNKMAVYREILEKRQAKLFIGDESQYLKTPRSQRTQASMSVAKTCDYVYLLSGTPLKNRPRELITQLQMLRVLDSGFGGESAFLFQYCGAKNNGFGYNFNGASNLPGLRQKLRETCMVRRLKDDVMDFLPKKHRMRIPVELPNRKEYDKANSNFRSTIVNKVTEAANLSADTEMLTGKQRKAFIDDFISNQLEKAARAEILVHINILRQIVARGLQTAACEWIEGFCENGEPLVVFVYHREQQEYLYRHLCKKNKLRVGKIMSGMSDESRKQVELDFQAGKYDVVICSIMSANTNITLTAATTVLTVEYLWVPGDHIQAEDRCRRIGTSTEADSINCYYLHADDTVDDLFWQTITKKFKVIEQSMDRDEGKGFENLDGDARSSIINGMMAQFDFINDVGAC